MKTSGIFLVFILLVSSFCLSSVEAKPFNDIEWGLLQLERIAMKTQIVESDMRLCIDRKDFYGDRKEASKDALTKLQVIKKALEVLVLPSEIEPLRPLYESSIMRLENLYKNLDKKSEKEIGKEVDYYWKFAGLLNEQGAKAANKWLEVPNMPKDFNPLEEELKIFKNVKDRNDFLNANSLIQPDKLVPDLAVKRDEAWKIFNRLYKEYRGTSVDGSILAGLIQISEMSDNDKSKVRSSDPEKHAAQIKVFLNQKKYSVSLLNLYLLWVPLEQMNNGMSNMSDIPNDMYVNVRWQIVNTIKKYLIKNPNDSWARIQVLELMDQPIIFRDCGDNCLYGNSAFQWIGRSFYVEGAASNKADSNNVDKNKVEKLEALTK